MKHKTSYYLTKNIITTTETLTPDTPITHNIINIGYSPQNRIHYAIIIMPSTSTDQTLSPTQNTLQQEYAKILTNQLQNELINHSKQTIKTCLTNATNQTTNIINQQYPNTTIIPITNLAITRINEKQHVVETSTQGNYTALIEYKNHPSIKVHNHTIPPSTKPQLTTYKNTLRNLQYIITYTTEYETITNYSLTKLINHTIQNQGTQLLTIPQSINKELNYILITTQKDRL